MSERKALTKKEEIECNLKNLNNCLEDIGYSIFSGGYEHYSIKDHKDRSTGWEIWDDTLSYKQNTVTDPVFGVHFMFGECIIKANNRTVTICIKDKDNPGVFVSFYNFDKVEKSE